MSVNVYTDDVEVVNGSSLDMPVTTNFIVYGNESGKSVKIPNYVLAGVIEGTLVENGSCLSNTVQMLEEREGSVEIDLEKVGNNDVLYLSDNITEITITGKKVCRFSLFFTFDTGEITINTGEGRVYVNNDTLIENQMYHADITVTEIDETCTIFVLFHEMIEF